MIFDTVHTSLLHKIGIILQRIEVHEGLSTSDGIVHVMTLSGLQCRKNDPCLLVFFVHESLHQFGLRTTCCKINDVRNYTSY